MFKELSLHILDIAENSVNAGATNIQIMIQEDLKQDKLEICIHDNGRGMNQDMLQQVTNPFITTRTTRKVGLGIPFLKETAEACNGSFYVESNEGEGTQVKATFQRSHIDRMPLGDIQSTFLNLLVGFPLVHWEFTYRKDSNSFYLDDDYIKNELQGIPLTEPVVINYLRNLIDSGINQLNENSMQEK